MGDLNGRLPYSHTPSIQNFLGTVMDDSGGNLLAKFGAINSSGEKTFALFGQGELDRMAKSKTGPVAADGTVGPNRQEINKALTAIETGEATLGHINTHPPQPDQDVTPRPQEWQKNLRQIPLSPPHPKSGPFRT
jgi:hypothetical protein